MKVLILALSILFSLQSFADVRGEELLSKSGVQNFLENEWFPALDWNPSSPRKDISKLNELIAWDTQGLVMDDLRLRIPYFKVFATPIHTPLQFEDWHTELGTKVHDHNVRIYDLRVSDPNAKMIRAIWNEEIIVKPSFKGVDFNFPMKMHASVESILILQDGKLKILTYHVKRPIQ